MSVQIYIESELANKESMDSETSQRGMGQPAIG